MDEKNVKKSARNLAKYIEEMENKKNNIQFFVYDTRGIPTSEIEYIYDIALSLHKSGYNVTMLHTEENFQGTSEWAGDRYAELEHKNIEKKNVTTSPNDILFIPEVMSDAIVNTRNLLCKRVLILQNMSYFIETATVGSTLPELGIYDVVVPTKALAEQISDYFPGINTMIIRPYIKEVFRRPVLQQKLQINVVANNQNDVSRIRKPFYWKNPLYRWVSFVDLRVMPKETFANELRNGAITVWVDDETKFGCSALEALRSGTILIAKIPDTIPEWAVKDGKLIEGPIWFDNFNALPKILSSVVRTWTIDDIPQSVYDDCKELDDTYTKDWQDSDIKSTIIDCVFENRLNELKQIQSIINNENAPAEA